ncbi:hypothetical protein HaLaN_31854 [Haematococcus lacustris]|uniref:Uncharacterized protein n=1 Tax=Haematococcus lacustris TaxID=44745 RepID=A0A6A0AI74_HAELA|nr:hypothetical protein HaLaN_31854 [Haematococcus lacustris]
MERKCTMSTLPHSCFNIACVRTLWASRSKSNISGRWTHTQQGDAIADPAAAHISCAACRAAGRPASLAHLALRSM